MKDSLYFFAETAFHHQGEMDFIKKLIDEAKSAGVNGVKFQVLIDPDGFLSKKNTAFSELSSYCFLAEEWLDIFEYTLGNDLDIIAMPLSVKSSQLLKSVKVSYLDIHSVSFYDLELHKELKKLDVPILLGIGGRELEEIKQIELYFGSQLQGLLVGFQGFPSKLEDVNLLKIQYYKSLFPALKIGYADHTKFDELEAVESNVYARVLGATLFEKHITICEGKERVDFVAAISGKKIRTIIQRVNAVDEQIFNNNLELNSLSEAERKYRDRELKVVANKSLAKGTILNEEDLCLRMVTDVEDSFNTIEVLVGKEVLVEVEEHGTLLKSKTR